MKVETTKGQFSIILGDDLFKKTVNDVANQVMRVFVRTIEDLANGEIKANAPLIKQFIVDTSKLSPYFYLS